MRSNTLLARTSVILTIASLASANHKLHEHVHALHKRHHEHAARSTSENETELEKRDGQCQFPYGAGLVPVAPGGQNAGWAMSPDEPCKPGGYCPYACPPGQVMAQWDPSATTYSYPKSMNGGLYCDNSGQISKPFPDKPYCVPTASNIGVTNTCGGVVSFCQTVLPGNEAMLIPTEVWGTATLANPGPDYWASTAAHFYINAPGVPASEACVWGTNNRDVGNWSPYVAGTNTDNSGNTFIKLGWNPIYLEPTTPFRNNMPNWGVKIECPDGKCNGLPCEINPKENWVNQIKGSKATGAGGADFCVVTVPKGSTANFVVSGGSGKFDDKGMPASGPPGGPGGPGGNNHGGPGGQFYPGSSTWADVSMSSTSASSSSSTTSAVSSTWGSSNKTSSTTGVGPNPSKQPHNNLFDAESSSEKPSATLTSPYEKPSSTAAAPSVTIASATGGAAGQTQWSLGGLVVALIAAITLL